MTTYTMSLPDFENPDRFSVSADGKHIGLVSRIRNYKSSAVWCVFCGGDEIAAMPTKHAAVDRLIHHHMLTK